ncbi:hypothetical protein F4777DRAFT_529011 [Nemania sp. FL0916]|nr:hypothetical protein F4777DRAFT_529011 [Nemania sp. FL0916]
MNRNRPETGGVLTTKPNGQKNNTQRPANRPRVKKSSSNPDSKENSVASDTDGGARATPRSSHDSIRRHRPYGSLIESPGFASPSPSLKLSRSASISGTPQQTRNTRIPRPASTGPRTNTRYRDRPNNQDQSSDQRPDQASPMRQPMSMAAAFRRAKEQAAEENDDSDNTMDLPEAFRMAKAELDGIQPIDGSPSPAPRPFHRFQSVIPSKSDTGAKDADLNTHFERFDRNHRLVGSGGPRKALFTSDSLPTVLETERTNKNKATDLSDNSGHQELKGGDTPPKTQDNIKKTNSLPEELSGSNPLSNTIGADVAIPSIEHECASDDPLSPGFQRIKASPEKSMNWHLDADFTASDLQISQSPRIKTQKPSSSSTREPGTPASRRQINNKLSQIQQREADIAETSPVEDKVVAKQTSRLDDIKAREAKYSSKGAVASSRLDEIRARNSESRSKSPESYKDPFKFSIDKSAHTDTERRSVPKPSWNLELGGEPINGTPVVVFRSSSDRNPSFGDRDGIQDIDYKHRAISGSDSRDLLRRLARAASSSPRDNSSQTGLEKESLDSNKTTSKPPAEIPTLNRLSLLQDGRRAYGSGARNPRDRPTVGFADLMRTPSDESIQGKQTSRPTSEVDPTDRIAAELNLFAPLDNYSERGSIKAPSPVPSEPQDEATPRPPRMDPLTLPTPRVTGAYVDTPATIRPTGEGHGLMDRKLSTLSEPAVTAKNQPSSLSPSKLIANANSQDRSRRARRLGPRSSSDPLNSRRSRSSSRRRRPLINTAKPPTVREDIISILRANNIDDSTLENLDSILAGEEADDQEIEPVANDTAVKAEGDPVANVSDMSDRQRELAAYDRMSKSLQTGLLGIRSAKKGIERLEDKVNHNGGKDDRARPVPQPPQAQGEAGPVYIALPRLYRRNPRFKLTTLGVITICVFIWYVLECAFCSMYAGPNYICTPTIPCDWSPHEPYFPYTMPFMLDEWTTGGKGKAFALKAGEEIGDLLAEVSDWVTNTDFTRYDERYMDVWQRKRHRRRLRKHGLIPEWTPPPGYEPIYPEWQARKAARELAEELGEDETMSADEVVH